ncbi:3484_t:CDS:2 [Gigaspora margarita]|uniref:3484_t:CDS:1 n=1 Tax=Gigaspora margarita TaxID=4874 RepID=A0ABM8W1L9_GIGMA|nr:3484_t:CDS:2 [Gigaspora margarita]
MGYTLLLYTILSSKLLEQENARIENKIKNNLEKAGNLALKQMAAMKIKESEIQVYTKT